MRIRTGRSILVVALACALALGATPVSAAPIQYAPLKYVPQQGLTVTFYRLSEAARAAQAQSLNTSLYGMWVDRSIWDTQPPEYVPTVVKTATWTPGMDFSQETVDHFRLDELSWAGMKAGDWVEITGWVRPPMDANVKMHYGANTRVKVFVNDQLTLDCWDGDDNDTFAISDKGWETPVKIRICLSPIVIDENSKDPYYWPVDCWFDAWLFHGRETPATEVISADCLYPRFPVDAFRLPVMIMDDSDLIYIDDPDIPDCLDLNEYEFGTVGGTFETLHRGDNYIAPRSGQYAVRAKAEPEAMYVLGTLSVKPPTDLKIVKRTPTTATLTWTPAWQSPYSPMPPVSFEIYRKTVDWDESFGHGITSISTVPGTDYAGSTIETTFTDEGLLHDAIYEYFVRAVYPDGYGDSAPVRTDAIGMAGLLSPPSNLAVVSNDGREVVFQWTPVEGAKGYQVLREDVATPSGWTKDGTYAIGKTSTATFKETKATGMEQQATYRYYVQAVDADGIPSRLSVPIEVVIKDATPPSAPGSFAIEGGLERVLLGPTRQVSMSWEPSTDNVGVVGYDILRSAVGSDGNLPGDAGLWQEPVHKVGSTTGTSYSDIGLTPGACYTYYVAARDAAGNTSQSRAFVIVHCPYLLDLTATGEGKAVSLWQRLPPEVEGRPSQDTVAQHASASAESVTLPAGSRSFEYNHGEYAGVVDNATKTLTLNPTRIDPKATVLVNGDEIPDGAVAGPYPLEVGENRFEIVVVSRPTDVFWGEARMTYTVTVTRANLVPLPVLTVPSAPAPVPEGSLYQASGSISTVATSPWTGAVDYGDGSAPEALAVREDGTFDLLHSYADNGEYAVKVAFRYSDLGLVTTTVPVTVTNVPPAINVGNGVQEYTLDEGTVLGLAGVVTDPGADTWTLTADFGDSSGPVVVPVNPGGTFYVQHVFYDDKPAYQVSLSATDDDGGTGSLPLKVNVNNVAPVVAAGGPAIAQRGAVFQRAGSFADPGRDTWVGTVDFGDGSGKQALGLGPDKSFLLKHVYKKNGQYAVTVRVADNSGAEDVERFPVVVKDFAFSLDAGADLQVNEGAVLQTTARIAGPLDKIVALTVDYGDGSAKERLAPVLAADGQSGAVTLSHAYSDNGQFIATVTLIDADGYTYKDSFTADVANIAPEVTLAVSSVEPEDRRVEISGLFTDPGEDTWTGAADFGDGSVPSPVLLNKDKTFALTHTYMRPGVYTVTVTVRDDDRGEGAASCRVDVRSRESSDATLEFFQVGDDILIQNGSGGTSFTTDCATMTPTVQATPSNGHATLAYLDTDDLWAPWPGDNIIQFSDDDLITIRVTAENGRTLVYTIEHQ